MPVQIQIEIATADSIDVDLDLRDSETSSEWIDAIDPLLTSRESVAIGLWPPAPAGLSIPNAFHRLVDAARNADCPPPMVVYVVSRAIRDNLARHLPSGPREPRSFDLPGGAVLTIALGDIVRTRVDAIVNASNTRLVLGSGVSGAIREAAGPALQVELDALAAKELAPGDVVATPSHGLRCARVIFHAATVAGTVDVVAKAVRGCLALAAEQKLGSIAFPALGSGVGGLAIERCAETMIGTIKEVYAASSGTLPAEVRIVCWTGSDFETFVEVGEA